MNTKNGVCKFCGRSGKVVDEVCEICARGWDYELELELRAEWDALELPTAQANLGGGC